MTRELIENYLILNIWFLVHQDSKEITPEQFVLVLTEIGRVQDELKAVGISEKAIQGLYDFAQKQVQTPFSELSENSQLRMAKIIFGGKTEWSIDPHPLSKA